MQYTTKNQVSVTKWITVVSEICVEAQKDLHALPVGANRKSIC